MRSKWLPIAVLAGVMSVQPAFAELAKVETKEAFVQLVSGKTLSRPLIKLQVDAAGTITGRGVRWDVTGQWAWKDGYFCRDMNWGGTEIGYNCQEVRAKGDTIRFTSDQGTGDYADFRLR